MCITMEKIINRNKGQTDPGDKENNLIVIKSCNKLMGEKKKQINIHFHVLNFILKIKMIVIIFVYMYML